MIPALAPGRGSPLALGRASGIALGASLAVLSGGCSSGPEGQSPTPDGGAAEAAALCPRDGAALTATTTFAGREGTYRLRVTADEGTSEAVGALRLAVTPEHLREVRTVAGGEPDPGSSAPLFGWTDLDPALLGATAPGDPGSRDPLRPGVLVLEQASGPDQPPTVVLRLGSHANDRSRTTFDQAHLALHVEWTREGGAFGGRWSGGVRGVEVKGTFCAVPSP